MDHFAFFLSGIFIKIDYVTVIKRNIRCGMEGA